MRSASDESDDDFGEVTSASHEASSPASCAFFFRHAPSTNVLTVGCAVAVPRRRTSAKDNKIHQISLYQFEDTEFANLESILVRTSPLECHHPDLGSATVDDAPPTVKADGDEAEEKPSAKKQMNALEKTLKHKLVSTLEVLGIESKPHKVKSGFDIVEVTTDLQALVGEEDLAPHRLKLNSPDWKLALQAASLLCRKEGYMQKDELRGAFTLEFESLSDYMRLDAAAVTALNLLPSKEDRNRDFSVLGVLDKTVTKRLGTRLLTKWVRHPLVNVVDINKRQNRVAILFGNTETREVLRGVLKSVPDLDQISRRFATGKGGLEDLYLLYRFAELIPSLSDCMQTLAAIGESTMTNGQDQVFQRELESLKELEASGKFGQYKQFVEDVLDLNMAPREFLIRAKHDETGELERLASEREDIDADMDKIVRKLLGNELAGLDAKFETDRKMIRTHGHHFRIPKKHDQQLVGYKFGRTVLVVQACIRWTSLAIEELSDRRAEIVSRQNQVQGKLVKEAMQVAVSYLPLIEMSATLVSELDVLASFAHVAATCPQGDYTRPEIFECGQGDLYFPNARHPCLELQPGVNFVPNTHDMQREASKFQILTGPNMGGKSTFARQLGVLCVMAQMGSFIPCGEGAKMPVMDAVLARVGASDSQLRGISTFMAEMIEASNIVKTCTDASLVIIDELGRGTSTYDGFGLAWAISEHLASNTNAFVIFATHFHELTELARSIPGVCNMHVAALVQPDGKVIMLHEVRKGQCDESFGVNIAKVAGFPDEVIEDATNLLKQMDKFKGFEGIASDSSSAEDFQSAETQVEDASVRKKLRMAVEAAKNVSGADESFVSAIRQTLTA